MHQKTAKKHDNNQNQKLYLKNNQGQESLREARASGSPWPKLTSHSAPRLKTKRRLKVHPLRHTGSGRMDGSLSMRSQARTTYLPAAFGHLLKDRA